MAIEVYFTLPFECLILYTGHSLGEGYPSAEMQPMFSLAQADWAEILIGY